MNLLSRILGRTNKLVGIEELSKKLCNDGYNFIIINYDHIDVFSVTDLSLNLIRDPNNKDIINTIGYLRPPMHTIERKHVDINHFVSKEYDKIMIDMYNDNGFFGKNPEKTFLIPFLRKLYEVKKQNYIIILSNPPIDLDKSLFEYESFSKDVLIYTNPIAK